MSEVMNCPHCGGAMQIAPEFRGRAVACPHCKQALNVPPGAAAPPPLSAMPSGMRSPAMTQAPAPAKTPVLLIVGLVGLGVLVVLGVLAGFLLPALAKAQGAARRTACMNNIRQIGLASIQYAGDNDDEFMPLVDLEGEEVPTAGKIPTHPARTGFLVLLRNGYITTPKVFVCTSSKDKTNMEMLSMDYRSASLAELREAFGEMNCSYGWDPTKKHSVDATCAIVADKPPMAVNEEDEGSADNNSPNHDGDGQNVFYNDGHVKWATDTTPDAGDDPDIYTGAEGYETSNTDAKIIR